MKNEQMRGVGEKKHCDGKARRKSMMTHSWDRGHHMAGTLQEGGLRCALQPLILCACVFQG